MDKNSRRNWEKAVRKLWLQELINLKNYYFYFFRKKERKGNGWLTGWGDLLELLI